MASCRDHPAHTEMRVHHSVQPHHVDDRQIHGRHEDRELRAIGRASFVEQRQRERHERGDRIRVERASSATRYRMLPVWPSEYRPGCGHTHRPCGSRPTRMRCVSSPSEVSKT